MRGPGVFESYGFLRQNTFNITCSLCHSFAARSKGVLSECKTSHTAIMEHMGFVITMTLDFKSVFPYLEVHLLIIGFGWDSGVHSSYTLFVASLHKLLLREINIHP